MAVLISNVYIHMFHPSNPWIGTVINATSSSITLADYEILGIYRGSGFKYQGNKVVGGTLKGYQEYSALDFSLYFSISGLNMSAKTAANYIKNGQMISLYSTALNGNDYITGSQYTDFLRGFNGNDSISGGAGDDSIFGDLGKDTLTGDQGEDAFIFTTKPSSTNIDKITDFESGSDGLILDKKIFKSLPVLTDLTPYYAIGSKALDANDYLIFNPDNSTLYYDADATGKGKMIAFVKILGITALDPANELISFNVI